MPPERIVLVGQSLGTAVASAVAEHFSSKRGIEFAGLVLVAAFSDLPNLVLKYTIKGIVPILSPLRPYPRIQEWLSSKIVDKWETEARLRSLVKSSKHLNLAMIHAKDDMEIPWHNTEKLFHAAANATGEAGLDAADIDGVKLHLDLGNGGWQNSWVVESSAGQLNKIGELIVLHGGRLKLFGSLAHERRLTMFPRTQSRHDLSRCSEGSIQVLQREIFVDFRGFIWEQG